MLPIIFGFGHHFGETYLNAAAIFIAHLSIIETTADAVAETAELDRSEA